MDSKYPNLARPRKKLRYFSNKASASTAKGNADLDVDDSNTWFKDLDSPSDVGEELPPLPPSPTFAPVEEKENKTANREVEKVEKTGNPVEKVEKTGNPVEKVEKTGNPVEKVEKTGNPVEKVEKIGNPVEKVEKTGNPVEKVEKTGNPVEKVEREPSSVPETGEAVPQGEEMHKEGTAESTLLDTESPFKKHAPIKTSSPIKRQERDEDKDRTASPLLLICDDDDDDDDDGHGPIKQPITALTPQCNGQAADGGYDAVLDSPPCRFSVSKQKTPVHSMPKKEETPWKLTLSLCSVETEPEEPPQTSPYPAVELKEQPAPGKKSLAQPSEKKSLAQPPEKKSLAQPPEKKSLAQPPEKKSLAQPPEKKSLAQPPEKKSLAQPPEKKSLAQPPEKKSLAQPPEKKSLAQPPEKKSLAQPSEKKSLAQPPEKKSLAQPPEKKSLAQPPEKKSLAQPPEKKSLAQPPEKKSLAQPPEKKSLAQPPEKKRLAQPPEKKRLAQPPEKKGLAQPPEKKSLAQPPEEEATQERKATSSFLQKLREAGQSNPACPRKALASPVREAPLTDLEDDFLILEDDGPSWFSLRWKTDPNRATPRPQQKDQSHSSNDASADTLTKASQSEKDTAKLRSEGTADVKTKEKNATGGSSLIPVLTKSTARKKRDSSPQGDGPVEADHIEQDQKKKVNNPLSEPTTAGELEPGGGAKPKPSQSKARTKTEKKVPRISKFQGYKVNPKTSRGRGRQSGKTRRLSAGAGQEPVVMEEECEAAADQDVSPVLQLAPSGQRRVKVPANRKAKEVGPSPTGEADFSQAGQLTQLAGKRKRIKPGPWWLTSPVNTQVTETDDTHTANKSKHNNKKTKPARYSSVESGQEEGTSRPLFNQNAKKKPSSNQTTENKPWSNQTAEHKAEKPKRVRPKKQKTTSREEPARPEGQREEEEDEASTAEQQEEQQEMGGLSPMPSPLRQHTLTPSEKVFDWIYTRTPKCKPQSDITPHSATIIPSRSDAFPSTVTPSRSDAFPSTVTASRQWHQAREAPEKRSMRRKAPGNWWVTNNPPENADSTSSVPQQPQPYPKKPSPPQPQPNPKTRKVERSKFLGPPQNGNTASSTRLGGVHTPLKRKDLSTPKTVKRSLATFGAIFSSGRGALPVATVRSSTCQTSGRKTLFPRSPEEQSAQSPSIGSGPANDPSQDPASDRSSSPVDLSASTVCIEPVGQLGKKKTIRRDFSQSNNRLSDNT
ncbi:serine/arginine repetitive matrix protein 1 [Salvelinus namaycush]|uniref:Serine/arginine repetitive matrix protein 1 n=1 Tax=Salvelinus namaycush TaxID=8040 RepID=A0A8U0R066_SALNM|nr:serine/arginine repetitive matrix protein 1 [Salvelinus namaycush]